MDHQNSVLHEANPSDAVQVVGWKDLPQAGQEFLQVSSDVNIFKTKNIVCFYLYLTIMLIVYFRF